MKTFALAGIAGFVAPRHLGAIRDTRNKLVAAVDLSDSVGILDQFFPEARFCTSPLDFEKLLQEEHVDFLSVCTPNHEHETYVKMGLRHAGSVICEKPVVIEPRKAEELQRLSEKEGKPVFNLLQLRYHPVIRGLKSKTERGLTQKKDIELTYITPRGKWYHQSWKGDESRSGGIATNIGIHFFDMLIWVFGEVQALEVHVHTPERAAGYLELAHARVRWYLSIAADDLPGGGRDGYSFREIRINEETLDFSKGFSDLHTKTYEAILEGQGCQLIEALPSIELTTQIRSSKPKAGMHELHPLAAKHKNQ